MSRLDVVKQCFTVLAERSLALALPLAMGMVQVDEQLTVASEIQDSLEDFNVNLERVDADGETKLWDACAKGADLLEEYASARTAAGHKPPSKRLIVLTDGADTESEIKMTTLARRLESMECVVDAVVVGKVIPASKFLLALAAYCHGAILIPPTAEAAMQ